jgi:sugar phosphate isomerase/epimerase
MASPPILFSTAAFFARPLSWTFELAAEAGFTGVEVMVTKDPDSQEPRRIRVLADEHGLRVGAIHAPCLLLTRKVWGTDPVTKIERSVRAAEDAGIPLVVVHPPYRWQHGFRRWMVDELPWIEQRTGIIVAVENMFPLRLAGRSLTFHSNQDLEQLDELDHLVLDTSHAAVARHDLIEVRRRFGTRLRHVHLSDNAGRGWDSHLPPGQGVLDLDGFLRDLGTDYEGAVSLEVDLRPALADAERLVDALVDMRERVEDSHGADRTGRPLTG